MIGWDILLFRSKSLPQLLGPSGEMTYVAIRPAVMGGTNNVDLILNFLREILFGTCKAPRPLEVDPRQQRVEGDAVIACINDFDYFHTRKRLISLPLSIFQFVDSRHSYKGTYKNLCNGLYVNTYKLVLTLAILF